MQQKKKHQQQAQTHSPTCVRSVALPIPTTSQKNENNKKTTKKKCALPQQCFFDACTRFECVAVSQKQTCISLFSSILLFLRLFFSVSLSPSLLYVCSFLFSFGRVICNLCACVPCFAFCYAALSFVFRVFSKNKKSSLSIMLPSILLIGLSPARMCEV